MEMLDILAVHGIAVRPDERAAFARRWRRCLRESGIVARVTLASWESSGSAVRDLVSVAGNATYRARQVDLVRMQIRAWCRGLHPAPSTRLIIGHSLGQALVATALELTESQPRVVSIGGPLGNPIAGRVLRAVGLGTVAPTNDPIDVYSADDRVTTLNVVGPSHYVPPGWTGLRVGVATSNPRFVAEHGDTLYLSHPYVVRLLSSMQGAP